MRNTIEKYPYLTITVLWLFVYLSHLGLLYPNIMEARNFITAREMLTDGNWLLTTMDGLPRYEKPPLPTWIAAIFGSVFGIENIAALRFPSALITLILLFMFFRLSRKLTQNKLYALISTLILGTSFFIIFAGRNGTWDIFTHSFMLCGIYYLFQFFQNQYKSYTYSLLAGLFIGLSFMSKGPVSHYALLLPFLISYGIVYKFDSFKKQWLPLFIMLIIVGFISSWWAYYIYVNDVADATRIAEKESSRWLGYEVKPFYYYWSFFTQSGVWTIPAFVSLIYPYLKKRVTHLKPYRFALLWTISSVILLSLIPTKKSRYLLPVLIPLALTVGFYSEYLFTAFKTKISKWEKLPVYFNYGLIGTIGVIFPLGAYLYFGEKLEGYYLWYGLLSLALFAIGVFLWIHLLKRNFPFVFYGTVAFIMFVINLGFPLVNAILGNPSYNAISKLSDSPIPVYVLDGLAPELVWNYGKVSVRKTKDELLSEDLEDTFGVLTYSAEMKTELSFLNNNYLVKYKETFDLNPVDSTKRGYKNRLKADYYIVTKQEK
ncbi:ArnT family glycosyltransferase [Gelidibacter salicanalis]|uniref:Glycosyltransferase family 39 protein n=1 Tax=Gelidibacter salicanalis TaxID=291193 RepID=A0A934KX82_9FLAO|nr:glycosyltransferase family 39 protein [Gelidibacter salicanalis]MBJ7882543.1 glycosyltransferase family 39 protein [Gelidibacter salicanalis]